MFNVIYFCCSAVLLNYMINLLFSVLLHVVTGGDSKALMFVQISPSDNDVPETLSSLNFASRVRGIELGPAKKQVDTAELQKVKQMVRVNIAVFPNLTSVPA